MDGTGGRHAKPYPKPKDTIPKEQLALEKAMKHAVQEDGNKTRVQLEAVEDGLHARHDHQDHKLDKQAHKLDKIEGLVRKGFGGKKLGTEPKIVKFLPTDDGCRVKNEHGYYVHTPELDIPTDAQRYTIVTVDDENTDGTLIVHFEDDGDKDKLTAEQATSLVSNPTYVGK